jgi:hypothetical protein
MNLNQFDLLGKNIDRGTPFYTGLLGARSAIRQFFGFDSLQLPIIQNNNVKAALRQGLENPNDTRYPYAYMALSQLQQPKDRQPVKNLRRQSLGFVTDDSNSTVSKFFGFPVILTMELHFVTNDILQAVQFATKALTLLQSGSLSFNVESEHFGWRVDISTDSDTISFPKADKDNEADPEAFDMSCSIIVSGYTGVIKEVPKINNSGKVTVTTGIITANGEAQFDE